MPFPSELTSDQLVSLRGSSLVNPTYRASEYAIFCPNEIVFQCRVNGAPTGTSYAQLSWDGASIGAYTDVVVGQTVYISSTTDLRSAEFIGRARLAPTSNTFYINEASVSIQDNWYITVTNDFRVWDRLARQVGSTQYKDYSITFTTPAPLIQGLQSAYAGVCSGSPEVLTLSFAPVGLPITSGATINAATWQWTVPSGMTITVGSDTDQNITAEFDAGFKGWVSVEVDDTNSKTGVFHFFVGAVPSDLSNVINLDTGAPQIVGDDNGWTGSMEAFEGVSTMLDNTLVVVFDVEYYNNVGTSIVSNVKFVGRIRKETDQTTSDEVYSQLKSLTYDLEGAQAQFGRIEHLPFTLLTKATPTKFDEIKDLTLWRAIAYTLYWHTTYLTLHSLEFSSSDTTFLYQALPTQGGNILSVVQDIAVSIDAVLESAPTGETRVVRDAIYLTGAQRAALPTIMNGITQDYINIDSLDKELVDTTGKIQGSGGFYNSISGKTIPLLSLAPGIAQGIGEGITTFARQVLQANQTQAQAQSELNTRTGHEYAAKRHEPTILNLTLPAGYNWLVPSRAQWYTWTIAASDTVSGSAFTEDERWQCVSVSYQHNNELGTKSAQATFRLETSGTPAATVVYPPQTQIPPIIPTVPTVPGFPTFPPLPDIILPPDPTNDDVPPYIPAPVSNGNTVAVFDAVGDWVAPDVFYTNEPSWREITPDETITDTDFQWVGLGSKGAYAIGNDTVNSVFSYTEDAISPGAVWRNSVITGLYTKIRVGSTPGEVYILGGETSWCYTFDFTIDDGGFTCDPGGGVWTPGVGWVGEAFGTGGGISGLNILFSDASITSIEVVHTASGYGATQKLIRTQIDADPPTDHIQGGAFNGTNISTVYTVPGDPAPMDNITFFWDGAGSSNATITSITICGVGVDPFGGSTDLKTRYSTDYGETFAAEETAAPSPGIFAGFDTQKVGTVALLGTSGQVMKAVSGGSWAAYGDPFPTGANPSAIWIPAKQFGGTTNNSGANPQYLVASDTLTAGDESLWKVTSSGTVFTDITPSIMGVFGVAVSQDCIAMPWQNGNKIAGLFNFDGDVHLMTSTNAGGAWTDRGILNVNANYVRFRKSDAQALQLFIANGDELVVSPSLGANLISKSIASDEIIGAEPF